MGSCIPVVIDDSGTDVAEVGLGVGSEAACPGDVAMGVWVQGVLAFGEDPARAGVVLPEREVIGRDIAMLGGRGKALFASGELVHQFEADIGFFRAEVYRAKATGELLSRFPTDLPTEPGLVTAGMTGTETAHEGEENGFDEVPIFGAASEQG